MSEEEGNPCFLKLTEELLAITMKPVPPFGTKEHEEHNAEYNRIMKNYSETYGYTASNDVVDRLIDLDDDLEEQFDKNMKEILKYEDKKLTLSLEQEKSNENKFWYNMLKDIQTYRNSRLLPEKGTKEFDDYNEGYQKLLSKYPHLIKHMEKHDLKKNPDHFMNWNLKIGEQGLDFKVLLDEMDKLNSQNVYDESVLGYGSTFASYPKYQQRYQTQIGKTSNQYVRPSPYYPYQYTSTPKMPATSSIQAKTTNPPPVANRIYTIEEKMENLMNRSPFFSPNYFPYMMGPSIAPYRMGPPYGFPLPTRTSSQITSQMLNVGGVWKQMDAAPYHAETIKSCSTKERVGPVYQETPNQAKVEVKPTSYSEALNTSNAPYNPVQDVGPYGTTGSAPLPRQTSQTLLEMEPGEAFIKIAQMNAAGLIAFDGLPVSGHRMENQSKEKIDPVACEMWKKMEASPYLSEVIKSSGTKEKVEQVYQETPNQAKVEIKPTSYSEAIFDTKIYNQNSVEKLQKQLEEKEKIITDLNNILRSNYLQQENLKLKKRIEELEGRKSEDVKIEDPQIETEKIDLKDRRIQYLKNQNANLKWELNESRGFYDNLDNRLQSVKLELANEKQKTANLQARIHSMSRTPARSRSESFEEIEEGQEAIDGTAQDVKALKRKMEKLEIDGKKKRNDSDGWSHVDEGDDDDDFEQLV